MEAAAFRLCFVAKQWTQDGNIGNMAFDLTMPGALVSCGSSPQNATTQTSTSSCATFSFELLDQFPHSCCVLPWPRWFAITVYQAELM
jgi:hypothetical protein